MVAQIERTLTLKGVDLPWPLKDLERISWNYWWSWSAQGVSIFRDLDPTLWEECENNPRLLLSEVSEFRLAEMATDPFYIERVAKLAAEFDAYMADTKIWQANSSRITPEHPVAYFCAEFGIHQSLPLYSGGLGILAGDHCKAASDFQLPFVAVGPLYRQGYFIQTIDAEGRQRTDYHDSEFSDLPIE